MENIDAPVSVSFVFDSEKCSTEPRFLRWNGRVYEIEKIGLHHTYRAGRTLFHVFSVVSKTLFFRLVLNTDNLHWKLEKIADKLEN